MNFLFFICLNFSLISHLQAQIYECPNYEVINNKPRKLNKKESLGKFLTCNFLMTNPKKVINPYKNEILNHVPSKPFGSVCFKCGMCLAIAKEMDNIFKEITDSNRQNKQVEVINIFKENINTLCHYGFNNYDLRKFKDFQIITDDSDCSTHVKTKMDGQWTEKLREMCRLYSEHIDYQFLLNEYLKGTDDISNYLCKNNGIFRDCFSLNFKNASININHKNSGSESC